MQPLWGAIGVVVPKVHDFVHVLWGPIVALVSNVVLNWNIGLCVYGAKRTEI